MFPKKFMPEKAVLFISAFISLAGLVGTIYVIRMGVISSVNLMGHSRDYEQGWRLFFILFLGIPCLLAFICGIMPWIWWRNSKTHLPKN